MKNIEYLIIPDVHGRSFWREPVMETLNETKAKIVFIGDFHDPYPSEFDWDDQGYLLRSVEQFKEIIELKKQNPDRIVLLIGNHDCGYAIGDDICSSRMDRTHRKELETLFRDNRNLFQIAEEVDIEGKHFIFSHAGILKGWARMVWGELADDSKFNVVNALNNAWWVEDYKILDALEAYDRFRGWGGYQYGSPVWSDIRSWMNVTPEETYGYNLVGHTKCGIEIVLDTIANLDCQQAFYIDDQGQLRKYSTDEICEKTPICENASRN